MPREGRGLSSATPMRGHLRLATLLLGLSAAASAQTPTPTPTPVRTSTPTPVRTSTPTPVRTSTPTPIRPRRPCPSTPWPWASCTRPRATPTSTGRRGRTQPDGVGLVPGGDRRPDRRPARQHDHLLAAARDRRPRGEPRRLPDRRRHDLVHRERREHDPGREAASSRRSTRSPESSREWVIPGSIPAAFYRAPGREASGCRRPPAGSSGSTRTRTTPGNTRSSTTVGRRPSPTRTWSWDPTGRSGWRISETTGS